MALSPAQCHKIRERILAEPRGRNPDACCYLAEHVLGFKVTWYFRIWVAWMLLFIRTVNLAKRGLGKSFAKVAIDVYRILCDPDITMVTISKTEEAAVELNKPVRAVLEKNQVLKQVFGDFMGRSDWADSGFVVAQRKNHLLKECTLEARGIDGQVAGGHWDIVWIDDGQDEERARSDTLTEKDWKWLFTTVGGALRDRARIHLNATPYTVKDVVTRLEDWIDAITGEHRALAFEIEDIRDIGPPAPSAHWMILRTPAILRDGASIDPERYPLETRVEEDGTVVVGLLSLRGTPGFETQQLVRKPVKAQAGIRGLIFKPEHLRGWEHAPERARLRTAQYIDPSWVSATTAAERSSRERDPDFFAIVTVGRIPGQKLIYVLEAWQDRLDVAQKLKAAAARRALWRPHILGCEKSNLQLEMKGAREFYRKIESEVGQRIHFVAPGSRGKILARAEPLARACAAGDVVFDPRVLDMVIQLGRDEFGPVSEQFVRLGDPKLEHDDIVDAAAGAHLLITGRVHSLAGFMAQADDGAPPSAPGAARSSGINRYLDQGDAGDAFSARAVPR